MSNKKISQLLESFVLSSTDILPIVNNNFTKKITGQTLLTFTNQFVAALSSNWNSVYSSSTKTSADWDSVYSAVRTISATWDSVYSSSRATSATWDSVYTSSRATSADWNSVYSAVRTISANWDLVYSTVRSISATWDSVYSSSKATSANWDSVYSSTRRISAEWDSVYSSSRATSADWNSVYSAVKAISADWNSVYTNVKANSSSVANYLPLSGGLISGNLTVYGNLSSTGVQSFANTIFTVTSAISVVHYGDGTALYIGNNGPGDIASFYDIDQGVEMLHVGGINSQRPNIGIKTSAPNKTLTVVGEISATEDITTSGSFRGDGSNLTDLNASSISSGTLSNERLPSNITISSSISAPTLSGSFYGDGSKLTNLFDGNVSLQAPTGQQWTNPTLFTFASGSELYPANDPESVHNWVDIATSYDGTIITALYSGDSIYVSSDSGQTWLKRGPQYKFWVAVAVSNDGSKQIAVTNSETYVSINYGLTWSSVSIPTGVSELYNVNISGDGNTIIVTANQDGDIWQYFTTDYGVTWQDVWLAAYSLDAPLSYNGDIGIFGFNATLNIGNPLATTPVESIIVDDVVNSYLDFLENGYAWVDLDITDDGLQLAGVSFNGLLYTTKTGGWNNFVAVQPGINWKKVSMSADGTKLIAVTDSGEIYVSRDSGNQWISKGNQQNWSNVKISRDGTYGFFVRENGLYRSFIGVENESKIVSNVPISASVFYGAEGNSSQWNRGYAAYTNLIANSSAYLSGFNLSTIAATSATWNEAYTNLVANSAYYLSGAGGVPVDLSTIAAASATWNDVSTKVQSNSAVWTSGPKFVSDLTVSLPGGKTFGRYGTGEVIAATGKTAAEVIQMAIAAPINPTVSLTTSTTIAFNQTAISNTMNYSYTINTLGAAVSAVVLEWRRNNTGSWTTLYEGTDTSGFFVHTLTDTAFNTQPFNYRYSVVDNQGARATATRDITPAAYVAPTINLTVAANSLTSPEVNLTREQGNVRSNISGLITRNSANVALTNYVVQTQESGGAWTDIGTATSISGGSYTISSSLHSPIAGASTASTIAYRIKVVDAYTTNYSATTTINFYNLIFHGPSSTIPTDSAGVRALPSRIFTTGSNPFILNTGTTHTKFTVAVPSSLSITQVLDLDASNANVTSNYVVATVVVNNSYPMGISYKVYTLSNSVPYSSDHRHQITRA